MTTQELQPKIVLLLEERIADEYTAHFHYQAAANWCEDKGYVGGASFFKKESDDELEHARKLQKFVVDWNVVPKIVTKSPDVKFNSLVDIINRSYKLELDLYNKYNDTSKTVMGIDLSVFDFLEWFREIQTESIAEYSTLLNKLELINKTNGYELKEFDRTVLGA